MTGIHGYHEVNFSKEKETPDDTYVMLGKLSGEMWFELGLWLQQKAMRNNRGYSRRKNEHGPRHRGWKRQGAVTIISSHDKCVIQIIPREKQRLARLDMGWLGWNPRL